MIQTTEKSEQLLITADRNNIAADGNDLSFITVKVADRNGRVVPDATNKITFSIEGPGEIVATDNGDPADLVAFPSKERAAYSGMVLGIVRSEKKKPGIIKINAISEGLKMATIEIRTK